MRVGVSITKTCSFRGVAQEFSNTYYYDGPLVVGQSDASALIDAIVALEKPMHYSSVTFKFGRCWSAGGTKSENHMLDQHSLSGAGTNASLPLASQDKERAFLVRFRAGIDSRGRPVYLRKWWHLDIGGAGGSSVTNSDLQQTTALAVNLRTQLETWANSFKSLTVAGGTYTLVSEKGRQISGATEAHKYYEHHQLGDMWRG